MTPIRVAIVGLGRAGAKAVAVSSGSDGHPVIRNHLEAVGAAEGCVVAALVDPEPEARSAIMQSHPEIPCSAIVGSVDDLPTDELDLVVIATPVGTRRQDVASVLAKRPRALLLEKPLAANSRDARTIVEACGQAGVGLRVNFNRRLDTEISRFRRKISGTPTRVFGRYNNGLRNYASHMIDLLCHWYGPVESVQASGRLMAFADPLVSFTCQMKAGFEAHILAVPDVRYDQFEMELYFPDCRADLVNNGVEKRILRSTKDLYYPGYAHLTEDERSVALSPIGGFVEFYRGMVAALEKSEDGGLEAIPGCTGEEAVMNVLVLEAVLTSANAGGVSVPILG